MNSPSGARDSLDELMKKNQPKQTQEPNTVQISEEEWSRLSALLRRMEELIQEEQTERKTLTDTGDKYLSAMKKASEAQTESAAKAIRTIAENAEERVGKVSEKASRAIERRTSRDGFLWWLRLLLMALPTVLVLCLAVYLGWLRLLP